MEMLSSSSPPAANVEIFEDYTEDAPKRETCVLNDVGLPIRPVSIHTSSGFWTWLKWLITIPLIFIIIDIVSIHSIWKSLFHYILVLLITTNCFPVI